MTVDGLDASKHSVGEMAAHVGFVFQNPDHQIFCSTTKEEIAFGPTALGLDGATVFKRVDEMLTLFDLHRYEDVSPATLGYGERRAVALSSVLAMRTPILVLDEPESNLDFRNQMVVLNVIERLTEQGLGAVINTHFPAHALEISTKTLLVPRHRPPIFGDTRDVMTEDLLSDVFDVRVRIRELDFPERRYTCVAAVEPRHGGT